MKDMTSKVRGRAMGGVRLHRRLTALEAEVQECRQINLRLAELTDVVAELLLPVAQQDQARIADALDRYQKGVGAPRD